MGSEADLVRAALGETEPPVDAALGSAEAGKAGDPPLPLNIRGSKPLGDNSLVEGLFLKLRNLKFASANFANSRSSKS